MNRARTSIPSTLVCLTLLLFGCQRQSPTPVAAEHLSPSVPVHESWNSKFSVSEGANPRLTVDAAYISKYETEDSTYTVLRGPNNSPQSQVDATLYDQKGLVSSHLTAEQLTYFDNDRRFEARGNVEVKTIDDRYLSTEFLIWYEVTRRVSAPGFVRIEAPDERMHGYGLDADEDLTNYRLSRVSGQVVINN